MTINKAIDETKHAFGLDGSRHWSSAGLAYFQKLAQARNPTVRFLAFRAVISWGYVDAFFAYHWAETAKIAEYRKTLVIGAPEDFYMPVGRCAYGVLYPGEDPKRQAYHLLKTVTDTGSVDWTHDRLVIDNELHHNQSRSRITYAVNTYGEILKAETGRLPFHYMRYFWLRDHTILADLLDFPDWYAQYLRAIPGIRYRKEYPCPPNPTIPGKVWGVHQSAERGDPRPFGVTGKQVIDYDRWNGGKEAVFKEFNLDDGGTSPVLTYQEKVDLMYPTWKKNEELH